MSIMITVLGGTNYLKGKRHELMINGVGGRVERLNKLGIVSLSFSAVIYLWQNDCQSFFQRLHDCVMRWM